MKGTRQANSVTIDSNTHAIRKLHVNVGKTENITYVASNARTKQGMGSLIDRGANGGVAGDDVRIILRTNRNVNVTGIADHQLPDLNVCTVGGVVRTQRGEVIVVMNQYAYTGNGKTIHSSAQLESYKQKVDDRSMKVGGEQRITTLDGYVIPLNIVDGLCYMRMRPYTDAEYDILPQVILTSDVDWDPSVLDHSLDDTDEWFDAQTDLPPAIVQNPFDEFGDYRNITVAEHFSTTFMNTSTALSLEDDIDYCVLTHYAQANEAEFAALVHDLGEEEAPTELGSGQETAEAPVPDEPPPEPIPNPPGEHIQNGPSNTTRKEPNYLSLQGCLAWLPVDVIKRTFAATTQYARYPTGSKLKKMFKSPFPACNVHRRNEPVCTDTVYSDTPAIFGGETSAQIFVGKESLITDAYPMKNDAVFVNTLMDNLRERGAMNKLISDRAQVEVSERVTEVLRALCIEDWQSEPYHQHQNFAERRYNTLKTHVNRVMNRSGAPANTWFLCLKYVCFVLNRVSVAGLHGRSPLEAGTGSTPDISVLLRFHFWQRVYFATDDAENNGFPSGGTERAARMIGIAESVGHAMTYELLTEDTNKKIYRSRVRPCTQESGINKRVDLNPDSASGENNKKDPVFIQSKNEKENGENNGASLKTVDPRDLIGRTFLRPASKEEGEEQRFRCEIVSAIIDRDKGLADERARCRFICSVNDNEFEEIVTYNEILNHIENDFEDESNVWTFKSISAHQGPLTVNSPHYKGSRYNVLVNWETGEQTYEPLALIAADDPVTCAIYAKENNLLEEAGWRRFKSIAKRQKKLTRMIHQAKLRSFRTAKTYMYGYEVPRTHKEAMALDEKFKCTRWTDSETLEVEQLLAYETFLNRGKGSLVPEGYKKIRVHMIYAVKHDGRHKARLVAGGHLTDIPIDSVYSGVVSLRGLRMVIFLAELNGLETYATDIGNAYLEAYTSERVCIIAGPELGALEGSLLIIAKALYGLRSSGKRWHEKFADTLRAEGFTPSKAEEDIWMRRNEDNLYEYIAVYVDDLALSMKNPKAFCDVLMSKYKYKLKGTGPIAFHLGCDFFRDDDGCLCFAPRKYVDKMCEGYERMFGEKPNRKHGSPLEKGDHPELDGTEFLEPDGIKKYQSMIGALQWAVSIGRADVTTAVMTMSGYRVAPRQGHLERAKRIYGFLLRFRDACIRIRIDEPDYSDLPNQNHDWLHSVYGNVSELIPLGIPEPLGNYVTTTTYVDANLYHDMITGRSVTGIMHFMNQTLVDWYSRKQATVETATYGSEFVAARTATDQIMDLRLTLRYLGVPIRDTSYMFGDNKAVVDSSTVPHAKLHKRHNALSFHRVREAVCSGMVSFFHIGGIHNPADILSKHWGFQQVKTLMELLFLHNCSKKKTTSEPMPTLTDERGVTSLESD